MSISLLRSAIRSTPRSSTITTSSSSLRRSTKSSRRSASSAPNSSNTTQGPRGPVLQPLDPLVMYPGPIPADHTVAKAALITTATVFGGTWLYLYFTHQAELRRQNATKEELIDRRADQILEIAKQKKAEEKRKAEELAMDLDLDGVPHSGDVLPIESGANVTIIPGSTGARGEYA